MPAVPPPIKVDEIIKNVKRALRMFDKVSQFVQGLRRNKITYRDLISDIVEGKPQDDRICKCSVLRTVNENNEIELAVIYLDFNDAPVLQSPDGQKSYGFLLTAKEIDAELNSVFNGKDCIIIS